jgi:TonB family protein
MLSMLAAVVTMAAIPPMRPDTPPPLPVPLERLAQIKSNADVIAASRLADGSPAPATLLLPHLQNTSEVLGFMVRHYPSELMGRSDFEMPWAWLLINREGLPVQVRILKTSGRAEFDSLAVSAVRRARFAPALLQGQPTAVWTPLPIEVAYRQLARGTPREQQPSDRPTFTPFTVKPELLNRDEVRQALVKSYPRGLRLNDARAITVVWVHVDKSGNTASVHIRNSSGNAQLDEASLAVARIMRWSPAMNGREVVPVWIQVPVVFASNTPKPQ